MDINQRIGAQMKLCRLERKLSREQVARRLGCSQQTIEKYENGSVNISVKRLVKISCVLGICITIFLQDEILHEHFKKILLPKS